MGDTRLIVINARAVALGIVAQAALFALVLWQLDGANEKALLAHRYAGQLDGQVSECVATARGLRDLNVDCVARLEHSKDRLAEVLDRCLP